MRAGATARLRSSTVSAWVARVGGEELMRRAGGVAAILAVLAGLGFPTSTPAAATPAVAQVLVHRVVVVGRSVEGRPIEAIEVGDPDATHKELVVGCIHGTECAGIAVADTLAAMPPQSASISGSSPTSILTATRPEHAETLTGRPESQLPLGAGSA